MKTERQDAWTVEDDNVLADIILRHIRNGSTQLLAFVEAGQVLGRTKAACGYRWNAVVRKQFSAQIDIAKAERRAYKETATQNKASDRLMNRLQTKNFGEAFDLEDTFADESVVSWNAVLKFLRDQKAEWQAITSRLRQLERDCEQKTFEAERVMQENRTLKSEVERLEQDLVLMREDYLALVQIMERARKMVFLGEAFDDDKPKFKMDPNGNLERIE